MNDTPKWLNKVYGRLSGREKVVLRLRFGPEDAAQLDNLLFRHPFCRKLKDLASLAKIAEELGVTREHIRRYELSLLFKITQAQGEALLNEYKR